MRRPSLVARKTIIGPAEAELHIMQGRMYQAVLNKARRGDLYILPPIGYVKLPTGELRQYQFVEPENRLVARTLEQQWESALSELQGVQQDY